MLLQCLRNIYEAKGISFYFFNLSIGKAEIFLIEF